VDHLHGDLKSANVLLKSTGTDARGFTCKVRLSAGILALTSALAEEFSNGHGGILGSNF